VFSHFSRTFVSQELYTCYSLVISPKIKHMGGLNVLGLLFPRGDLVAKIAKMLLRRGKINSAGIRPNFYFCLKCTKSMNLVIRREFGGNVVREH
jgi:hypothetical protein